MLCDLRYLTEMMDGKKHLIGEILDEFLKQIPVELSHINDAVKNTDYPVIKNLSHKMRSSVSIVGISSLAPVLQEMEDLGGGATDIEKIRLLNQQLNSGCGQAIVEIEKLQINYV
jgi:HPt (histidine-containing phosphotransfer) domain-containing protein